MATRVRTVNAQAHELYLLGRFLVDRMNPDDTVTAIGYYRQALQLDPRYALAWAGLAGAYSNQADYAWAPTTAWRVRCHRPSWSPASAPKPHARRSRST